MGHFSPHVLAAVGAVCFAASYVVAKRGLKSTSVNAGVLISLATTFAAMLLVVALEPPPSVQVSGVAVFAVAGLFAPGLGRLTAMVGVDRLGPSLAVPIQAAAYPLLAVMGATLFLREDLTLMRIIGVSAIVAGVWVLARQGGGTESGALEGIEREARTGEPWQGRVSADVLFPFIAGLSFAVSDVLKKQGLGLMPSPLFGAMIASGMAFAMWTIITVVSSPVRTRTRFGGGAWWFVLSGALVAGALMSAYSAFQRGDVSLVSSILATQPLVVFALSVAVLRDSERLRVSTVVAGTVVVAGAIMVSV